MLNATVIDLSLQPADEEQTPRRISRRTERAAEDGASGGWLIAGRYRVAALLGRGGMADVFCAQDELLHRRVAVKVFPTGREVQRRAEREIRILASLRHVNLITILDAGMDTTDAARPCPYLVMELINGPTLVQRIADGALDPVEVAELGSQIAAALSYVHDRDIVHRDIKPANIMLAPHPCEEASWTAKLTDFGIARGPDAGSLTVTGVTIGTASYLSPEQALGQPVRPSSDIYSLGLVLLEALTGARAFAGQALEVALARIDHPPQIPDRLGPDWVRLLTAMTAQHPDARPRAREVAAALQCIRAGQTSPIVVRPYDTLLGEFAHDVKRAHSAPPRSEQLISTEKSGFRRTRWIVLTALVAAIMAMSVLAVGAVSRSHRPPITPGGTTGPSVRPQAPRPWSTASPTGRAATEAHRRTGAPAVPTARPLPARVSPSARASLPTTRTVTSTPGNGPAGPEASSQGDSSIPAVATAPSRSASAGPTQSASASPTSASPPPPTSTPDASGSVGPSGTPSVPPT